MNSVEKLLEPENYSEDRDIPPSIDETGRKYGLDTDYDFRISDSLRDGAVAATARVPGVKIEKVDSFDDYIEADSLFVDDGQLYSARRDELIGFVADEDVYPDLGDDALEHVELHENHHLLQRRDGLWGDKLAEQYSLSSDMVWQLNEVDRLMDMSEHPLYRHLVDDEKVTALVEGYTERVTQAMQEDGEEIGKSFYPGYTQVADHLMKNVYGTDPEEEFS